MTARRPNVRRGLIAAALSAVALIAGCERQPELGPPNVRYGVDECAQCSMIISDERFAAALIADDKDGTRHVHAYDDINCMRKHEQDLTTKTIAARYVHDAKSKQWTDASAATYIVSDKIETPMASGIAAYEFKADAEAEAKAVSATVLTYAQINAGETAPKPAAAVAAGDATKGKSLFDTTCIACHGPGGVGMPNLGLPLTTSAFVAQKSDKELLDFIKVGRMPGAPGATSLIPMPPKGGNPALTDANLLDIIAYMRDLQRSATGDKSAGLGS